MTRPGTIVGLELDKVLRPSEGDFWKDQRTGKPIAMVLKNHGNQVELIDKISIGFDGKYFFDEANTTRLSMVDFSRLLRTFAEPKLESEKFSKWASQIRDRRSGNKG